VALVKVQRGLVLVKVEWVVLGLAKKLVLV
jgi:hypothetical protein